jgi:putative CocE/NonD family hydrolase
MAGPVRTAILALVIAVALAAVPEPACARDGYTRRSFYVEMRDGVPIAVDLYVPDGADESARVPAILRMTRYWRGVRFRALVRPMLDEPSELAQRFLAAGYAWLDVDVRGSGASGGAQVSLWSDDEVRDGAALVDWIVRQPWSSGLVGALGDSYDGTAAELLLVNRHPAVRAVAPRFALYDGYTDIGFPGGVHLTWFTETWGRYNDAIDRGDLRSAFPFWVPIFISGPRPVDGPRGAEGLEAAYRAHARNFDVHAEALATPFRDDLAPTIGLRTEDWSPHGKRRAAIEASGAAVFSYSGWYDGAYANAAIKRFNTLANPGQRLVLGPWNHGGDQTIEPLQATTESDFDHAAELLPFFDLHLKSGGVPEGESAAAPVRWYTTGENRWKSGSVWPPQAERTRFYPLFRRESLEERVGLATAGRAHALLPVGRCRARTVASRRAGRRGSLCDRSRCGHRRDQPLARARRSHLDRVPRSRRARPTPSGVRERGPRARRRSDRPPGRAAHRPQRPARRHALRVPRGRRCRRRGRLRDRRHAARADAPRAPRG